jgi:hypothetical protein
MLSVRILAMAFALGAEDSSIGSLYRFQAQVVTTMASDAPKEWIRVPIGPAVLEKLGAEAADFTIVDASGEPVDWLWHRLDTPVTPFSSPSRYVNARVKAAQRSVDRQSRQVREVFSLTGPPAGRWRLQLATPEPDFVRQAELQGRGFTQRADLFRLAKSGEENLAMAFEQTEEGKPLTVTLSGDDGVYLEPRFRFVEATVQGESAAELPLVTMKVVQRRPGTMVLALPEGVRPLALQFEAPSDLFAFRVSVAEGDALNETDSQTLSWSSSVPLSRSAGVDQLQLQLPASFQSRTISIRLTEMSGTSVDKLKVSARLPLVSAWLRIGADAKLPLTVFAGSETAAGRINSLSDFLTNLGTDSEGARRLRQQLKSTPQVATASLSEMKPNAKFRAEVPWTELLSAGAKVDVTQFSHQRALSLGSPTYEKGIVPPTLALYEVQLSGAEVDIARNDLGDVRLADANGNQWPYVWAPEGRPDWRPATLGAVAAQPRQSVYSIVLSEGRLPLEGVKLMLPAGLAERSYRLEAPQGKGWVSIGAGTLKQLAKPSTVELTAARVVTGQLRLTLDDGDDAPLRLAEAHLKTFPPKLWVVAQGGNYQLLVGQPKLEPPRYDLQRRASFLAALTKQPVAEGRLEKNARYHWQQSFLENPQSQKAGVYLVLGIAVALLALLTFRVLKAPSV